MLFFLWIQSLNLDENSTEATLSGLTGDGQAFEGTDTVTIIKPTRARQRAGISEEDRREEAEDKNTAQPLAAGAASLIEEETSKENIE